MTWDFVELGSICDVVSGATPKTGNPAFWDGEICWVTPKDLSDSGTKFIDDTPRRITEAGLKSCAAKILPERSVLFSSRAPIGLVAINTRPLCTNQGFKSFVPHDEVWPDYLYWWLKTHREQLNELGRGATFKEVSKAVVERVRIPLPPLEDQKRIAAILDAADDLRTKRRESLAQLDTLLQSTFLDLFGDPQSNPKKWNMRPLGEVTTQVYRYPTYYGIDYVDDGIPEVRGELIESTGQVSSDLSRFRFISQKTSDRFPRTQLEPGDLVMSVRGTIGKVGLIPDELAGANMTANLIRMAPDRDLLNPVFFWQLALGTYFLRRLEKASSSTTIKTIKAPDLKSIPIPLPPLDLQQHFTDIVREVEAQCRRMKHQLEEFDKLFASLQSRAFRGEL